MNRLTARVAGFAIPTVTAVTIAHLMRQASWGEGLDGVVSGLWFTLPFAAITWLRSRFAREPQGARVRTPGQEFALGLRAGLVTWAVLWLGWQLPSVTSWWPHAFAINSVVTGLAGFVLPASGKSRRPEPDSASGEPAIEQG